MPEDEVIDSIIDCGSNIGASVLFFKYRFPDCEIQAIEAFPETFEMLRQNVEENKLTRVRLINKAVAGGKGTVDFFSEAGSLRGSLEAQRGEGSGISVECFPLSDLITKPIDLLKIDVEGAEFSVFEDLERSGKLRHIKNLFIEYHHHLPECKHHLSTFLERLERFGFTYEIGAAVPKQAGAFQDILIRASSSLANRNALVA